VKVSEERQPRAKAHMTFEQVSQKVLTWTYLFFLLAIGLTILCPLIASDYPFGMIFKLFFRIKQYVYFG
jgi:hypothetical protein